MNEDLVPNRETTGSNCITPPEVRKMLNSIAWYYRRTNALEVPHDLMSKLPMTLVSICAKYTT